MAIFKCKMCGGALEINNETVAVCEYCATQQTLPKLDDERRINLYDRANHLRRSNEFDKASGIYEQILNENNTDAEAHWSLVLCRYGIEYVVDPATGRRVPTVNRAQFTSIFDDEDYRSALQYADENQKSVYEAEARVINEIQKGILAISQQEKPFDVFICYKESDEQGNRTMDSVYANDLYHQLTQEGFKVFFSRITLEDKLGSAYEPYIFAALNSARVMVVIGTRPEYFNAVWVKNEWSRYLTLVKNSNGKKLLIPAYKDMDPYDLPEEFSHLQAQDMSKIGFMQDLIRGIKKVTGGNEQATPEPKATNASSTTATILKRAFIFLEDGDWANADAYFEKVLDLDPENANAYLGKMLIQFRVRKKEQLANLPALFTQNSFYEKTFRYADSTLKAELEKYIKAIIERNEQARLDGLYQSAVYAMTSATTEAAFLYAAERFAVIPNYRDSAELIEKCRENAQIARDEAIYQAAYAEEVKKIADVPSKIYSLKCAIVKYQQIPEYKDAAEKVERLQKKADEMKKEYDAARKKQRLITLISLAAVLFIIVVTILTITVFIPESKYKDAAELVENEQYTEAITIYTELGDYRDSAEKINETKYLMAEAYLTEKAYHDAFTCFEELKNISYSDSYLKWQESGYKYASELMTAKKYTEAISTFTLIGEYEDAPQLIDQCYLSLAKHYYGIKNYVVALTYYQKLSTFSVNDEFYQDTCYKQAKKLLADKNYTEAVTYFEKAGNYSDAKKLVKSTKYTYVTANKNNDDAVTFQYLKDLKKDKYKDSASIYKQLYDWKITVVATDSRYDETDSTSTFYKYNTVYFHVTVSGGEPDASIKLHYKLIKPNGTVKEETTSYGKKDGGSDYESYYFSYDDDGGTYKFKIYDDAGNYYTEKSVYYTGSYSSYYY